MFGTKTIKSNIPTKVGNYSVYCNEYMYILYMPIKFLGYDVQIPKILDPFSELIFRSVLDYQKYRNDYSSNYMYVTAKHLFVTKDNPGNRPGWHIDGFGTNDTNYIWTNKHPTEFAIQDFVLSEDHSKSLIEMENQFSGNIFKFSAYDLLRLDNTNVHRVPLNIQSGVRTFFKLTFSKAKYNMEGNSHNYLFNYCWKMKPRKEERNHTNG